MVEWNYDKNKKRTSRMVTPDVKRFTRDGIIENAEQLWSQFWMNFVAEDAPDVEKEKAKKDYLAMVLTDFDKTANMTDAEYVAFYRARKAGMVTEAEELRKHPDFNNQIARINDELRRSIK
jgi:hypothetical protein